ncbi:uncharacterized protein MONBRDRAFT_29230 [Monosiga brevicollis MX1]|uniref:RBPJ-interacting and tubulin-associated protein 1 n=1 Tax=Monosiga brevicollis TaxID=81824 RepID=A9VAH7_MONBE|nr:uncharacterized protein MONBRDRAFT_29230 [Monosiga brevicollis MX1]EDQ85488.1 predicted protein [Monosiga brevicollis MX1]|eukprot:XP_001749679.1 hypothetical protein [Monosiga brevicollis MX1]
MSRANSRMGSRPVSAAGGGPAPLQGFGRTNHDTSNRTTLPPSQVLGRGRYKPVKAKASYVDESLFGEPSRKSASERQQQQTKWAAPWHEPSSRPTSSAKASRAQPSDRTSWLQSAQPRSMRAVDPGKYKSTDPWNGPLTNTAPPAKGARKAMPSDPWRGSGFHQANPARRGLAKPPAATIDLTQDKR